jgi:hypothetical protein
MRNRYRNKKENKEKVAIASKNDWTVTPMMETFRNEVFNLLIIWKPKTVQDLVFNARKDNKDTYYLLQLDCSWKITKILSNPNDHEM